MRPRGLAPPLSGLWLVSLFFGRFFLNYLTKRGRELMVDDEVRR
jgi:hypothetical protein